MSFEEEFPSLKDKTPFKLGIVDNKGEINNVDIGLFSKADLLECCVDKRRLKKILLNKFFANELVDPEIMYEQSLNSEQKKVKEIIEGLDL